MTENSVRRMIAWRLDLLTDCIPSFNALHRATNDGVGMNREKYRDLFLCGDVVDRAFRLLSIMPGEVQMLLVDSLIPIPRLANTAGTAFLESIVCTDDQRSEPMDFGQPRETITRYIAFLTFRNRVSFISLQDARNTAAHHHAERPCTAMEMLYAVRQYPQLVAGHAFRVFGTRVGEHELVLRCPQSTKYRMSTVPLEHSHRRGSLGTYNDRIRSYFAKLPCVIRVT